MTPRQYAAAQKKIQKLYAMKARAQMPVLKAVERNMVAMKKALARCSKPFNHRDTVLMRKLGAVEKKFEKRIEAIARKIP